MLDGNGAIHAKVDPEHLHPVFIGVRKAAKRQGRLHDVVGVVVETDVPRPRVRWQDDVKLFHRGEVRGEGAGVGAAALLAAHGAAMVGTVERRGIAAIVPAVRAVVGLSTKDGLLQGALNAGHTLICAAGPAIAR